MIYLFNSGFYPRHRINLLNTLYLPSGVCNRYRYSKDNLDPDIYANPNLIKPKDECVIVFVDRYDPQSYKFAPIRRAKLTGVVKEADHLFFDIILSDYLFPIDLSVFNDDIYKSLHRNGLPQLVMDGTPRTKDGRYAIISETFCAEQESFHTGNTAWTKAVDHLAERKAFTECSATPIFFKCALTSKNKAIAPNKLFKPGRFDCIPDRDYCLEITYRNPQQRGKTDGAAIIHIESSDNLKWSDNQQLQVGTLTDQVQKNFTLKKHSEDPTGFISLKTTDDKLLIPDANLSLYFKESVTGWLFITLALLVFPIAGVLIGVDASNLHPPYILDLLNQHWIKLIAAAAQTLSLFVLFRRFGKKIL